MLSVLLAIALAQPVSTSGACGPGKACRVRSLQASGSGGAIIVPTAAFINFYGASSGTTGIRATGAGIGVEGTSFYTGTGSHISTGANAHISMAGYIAPPNLPSPSTVRGVAADATTGTLYKSDVNAWAPIGTGAHPVLERRTWVTESDAASGVRWFNAGVPRVRHTNWNLATVGTFTVSPVNAGLLVTGQLGGATVRIEDVPWTTGAVSGDLAGYFNGGALLMPHTRRFKICQPVGSLSASTSIRIVIGQAAATLFTAPTDNPVNAGAWIRFSSAVPDTNFMLCTSDGAAAATCTSTGVAPSTTAGVGSVVCVDQLEGSAVTAWVDGRARVRVTSNITTSDATTGSFGAIAQTLTAATRTVSFGNMSIEASP